MKINQINDTTIQCMLTMEEMKGIDFTLDYINDKEKLQMLAESIIDFAWDEIGFEVKGESISIQIASYFEGELVITITDNRVKCVKKKDGKVTDISEPDAEDFAELSENIAKKLGLNDVGKESTESEESSVFYVDDNEDTSDNKLAVCAFMSLRQAEYFCSVLTNDIEVKSKFYKNDEGIFYLILEDDGTNEIQYEKLCARICEFGSLINNANFRMSYLEEHSECLIAENAIGLLKELCVVVK